MATLTGNQINNSYEGILKTLNNLALDLNGKTYFTDGAGNATNLFLTKSTTPTATNIFGFESDGRPLFALGNTNWSKSTYPMSASAGTITSTRFLDGTGSSTGAIYQDRYGSMYYENMYADQGESHVFMSRLGTGQITPAKISLNSYNNVNNSNNWLTAYNQSVTNLTVVGDQLTLTRQTSAPLTVTLPSGGSAGLVSGGAAGSMKSSDTLSDGNNNANSYRAIAIGSGNECGSNGTVVGQYSRAGTGSVAIGDNANNSLGATVGSVSIGPTANAAYEGVSIGIDSDAAQRAVAIGRNAQANGGNSIAIGNYSNAGSTGIGLACCSIEGQTNVADSAIMIVSGSAGGSNNTAATSSIVIGPGAGLRASAADVIAIGRASVANASGAVALGAGVTAAIANTVSVKELELQTVGGGIILRSPDGTAYKLTVANGGTLSVTAV